MINENQGCKMLHFIKFIEKIFTNISDIHSRIHFQE